MANDNRLNVEITSNVDGLKKGLMQADKGLKQFDKSAKTVSRSTAKMGKTVQANAVPALTSFSQVIQDAPYGIRGVANNITQLTSQFGYLSKSTGGAKAALSSMLGALTGPAGILFAVSAVTSLLVSYGDEIANIVKGNDELAKSQKAVNEALDGFYGGKVTKLNSYLSILENVNTSEEDRLRVTEELIKQVPSLKKEDFEYGNNLDKVRAKIGDYVLAQASRIEADTLVEQNSAKLAKKARIDQIKNIQDEEKRIKAFSKFLKEEGKSLRTTEGIQATSLYTSGGGVGGGGRSDRAKTAKEIAADFNSFADDLETELAPIQERINSLYSTTFGFDDGKGDGGKPRAFVKPDTSPLFVSASEMEEAFAIYDAAIQSSVDAETLAEDERLEAQLKFNNAMETAWDELVANRWDSVDKEAEAEDKRLENMLKQLQAQKAALEKFNSDIRGIIEGGIANSFSMIGDAIGEAFVTGGNVLQAAGQALTQGLANVLGVMGDYLIKAGAAAVVAGTITKLFGTISGVGAGLAAIAAGTALKALSSGISTKIDTAAGGGASGSGAGGSSFRGSRTSSSGFSGGGGGTYVFEIAGTKLIGVLKNTLDRNKALGGQNLITT